MYCACIAGCCCHAIVGVASRGWRVTIVNPPRLGTHCPLVIWGAVEWTGTGTGTLREYCLGRFQRRRTRRRQVHPCAILNNLTQERQIGEKVTPDLFAGQRAPRWLIAPAQLVEPSLNARFLVTETIFCENGVVHYFAGNWADERRRDLHLCCSRGRLSLSQKVRLTLLLKGPTSPTLPADTQTALCTAQGRDSRTNLLLLCNSKDLFPAI